MGFQILDKDNQPVGMNTLDREAAELWGKEVREKSYANPHPSEEGTGSELEHRFYVQNWYDMIGFNIHSIVSNKLTDVSLTTSWNHVVAEMFDTFDSKLDSPKEEDKYSYSVSKTDKLLRPYLDLISHWRKKGYKPVAKA